MPASLARPKQLYRFSEKKWLERSLRTGEFRLQPWSIYLSQASGAARAQDAGLRVMRTPGPDFLVVSFSHRFEAAMFDDYPSADACLVIHDVEAFGERLQSVVERKLPRWTGIDAPVSYGERSELGAVFSRPVEDAGQHEWRFAWRSVTPVAPIEPVTVAIGSLEKIAEIIERPARVYAD